MKYSIEIFTILPEDKETEEIPEEIYNSKIFEQFRDLAANKINTMLNQFEGIEYNKNKLMLFDQFYRNSHILYGFSQILNLKKISHLTSILEATTDYARHIKTTSKYSMDYLIKIILKEIKIFVSKLSETNIIQEDITAIIEECSVYLHKPIGDWLQKTSHPIQPITETEKKETIIEKTKKPEQEKKQIQEPLSNNKENTNIQTDVDMNINNQNENTVSIEPKPNEIRETNSIQKSEFDEELDDPEELNIPPSKIGLISEFYEESYENLTSVANQLLELENSPSSMEIINKIFRNFHTLKGGARLLNIKKMEKVCHSIENLLDLARSGKLQINSNVIDIILDGRQILSNMIDEIASKGPIHTRIVPVLNLIRSIHNPTTNIKKEKDKPQKVEKNTNVRNEKKEDLNIEQTEKQINKQGEITGTDIKEISQKPEIPKPQNKTQKIPDKHSDVIRVSTEKLDTVINISSELPIARIRFRDEIAVINKLFRDLKKILNRAAENEPINFLNRLSRSNEILIGEIAERLETTDISMEKLEGPIKRFYHEINTEISRTELTLAEEITLLQIAFNELKQNMTKNVENLETLTSKLQNGVMNFRMVPISSLFERFPTLVRELAKQSNKKIKMDIIGGDTELDRVMITKLVDPILHILRNSMDHGIESPEERLNIGKPEHGTIVLRAYYLGSYAVIEIKDDGRGIDTERVIAKAIQQELIPHDKASNLSQNEILELIFEPGFSTAKSVTELSGRGVGMDVVKSTIKEMQGNIELNTIQGKGTVISLKIPLTLAVVRVLLLEVGNQQMAFPMANVDEVLSISKSDLKQVGNQIMYHLRENVIPVIHLSSILDIPHTSYVPDSIPLIILGEGSNRLGVMVDNLLGRQEIVIKNLGTLLKKVPYIMGCTILSDNRLVLILNTRELMDVSRQKLNNHGMKLSNQNTHKDFRILIVDDSALHRQNMRAILSRSGFSVEEAENGYEALKLVAVKKYSLLCVDIVMPLMDGFELTKRLRSLPLYRNIPILLVTSNTSREDKDMGYKLGANEYFEKPIDPEFFLESINKYYTGGENGSK
ncbi:MAG: hybrid sensor histidine kinase/response regulator [Leptospiraceae bacterium]|nr:hybrid sensor histidine kinase/response regulator [Leptospiraceae bacterium]MCP5495551.1 hybrid sensor histidine kinase/response regulator [Leptospiraceae bacterium]